MTSRRGDLGIVIALAVAAGLSAGWARPARACINGSIERTDTRVQRIAAAERDLARDAPKAALNRLAGGPHVVCTHPGTPEACSILPEQGWSPALGRRWALAIEVAELRSERQGAERIVQHLQYLQQLSVQQKHGESPYIQARLAEALAHVKASAPRALELLADLEKRDIMPDASGYALLARLRREIGDAPGSERALERCRKIAGKRDACSAT
jgi:hypothetical protein